MARARFYKTLFIPGLEGQYQLWTNELKSYASKVDEIVQLGNLIGCYERAKDSLDRGPNLALLNYIVLWRSTYPNWTQIIGPNEIMALNYPDEWTNDESNRLLRRRWLAEEQSNSSFKVAAVNKTRLITHGGLSYGEWLSIGSPQSAQEAAERLNEKYYRTLFQGESYRLTGIPSFSANPIFADPVREVYGSWVTAPVQAPFDQIHSAGGLNSIEGRQALSAEFSLLSYAENVRYTNFGSVLEIKGMRFTSIYPLLPKDKMIKRFPSPWTPYIEKIPVIDTRDDYFEE